MQNLLIEFAKEHLVALAYATLWYVLAGLIAALFARKTRIDAWCEANPALALVLNFLRATGFDFWKILSALRTLASAKSKLPPVVPAVAFLFAIGASVTQVGCGAAIPRPSNPCDNLYCLEWSGVIPGLPANVLICAETELAARQAAQSYLDRDPKSTVRKVGAK